MVDPTTYPQWEPPFRWKRHHSEGGYGYSCSPELHRASVWVYRTVKGWLFSTKWGGVRGRIMTGPYTCKCCDTNIRGLAISGWKTHFQAQKAAEIFIAKDE